MKTSLFFGTTVAAFLVAGAASAAITKYPVTLNGAQENPAVTTAATGSGELELDDQTKKLTGKIEYTGLSGAPTAAHIHTGACGDNGGVAHALPNPGNDGLDVDVTLSDADITKLVAGELYVNVHTAANGGGEIRGQLYAEGSTNKCPADAPDGGSSGGVDSGTGGNTDAGNNGGGSSGGANDAGTVRADAGSSGGAAPAEDDGCSMTGSSPASGLAIAFGVGIAIAAIGRNRRKR